MSNGDLWRTPQQVIDYIQSRFGEIKVDLCASEEGHVCDFYLDIGDDFLAISHESITIDKLGFTIFNYETLQSEFVDISPYAISENERIVDIKRLDLNHLLLLTENQLIVYDILKGTITLQLKCDDTLGTVFHIWIN